MPPNSTVTYSSAYGKYSGYVCIATSNGFAANTATTVKTEMTAAVRSIPAANDFRMPSSSRAPRLWLVTTEKPCVSPDTKPSIKKHIAPVDPTPESAALPSVCPTTTVSTME